MSEIASGVLRQQLDLIATRTGENKWLTREQTSGDAATNPPGFVSVAVRRLTDWKNSITAVRRGVNVRLVERY